MAGQPLKRMMVAELERLAKEMDGGMSAIDYVCELTAAGYTLRAIGHEVGKGIGHNIEGGTLGNWVNSNAEWKAKLHAARLLGAVNLAEEGMEILDDVDESREAISKGKEQAGYRQWLASKWNRPMFGADTAQVNVQVTTGQLHLDALRQRQVTVGTQPILPPNGPDYEVVSDG